MSSFLKKIFFCILLLIPSAAFAYEKNLQYFLFNDVTTSGYIDTSYNYLLRNHQFVTGVNNRVNDLTQNGFTLQQAALGFAKQPTQGFGGVLDLFVGRDAYNLAPYGWDPYYGSQTLGFVVPNAYLRYAYGSYAIIGGLFETLIGQESYNPTKDTNFSRSILDGFAEPGILMGVRGIYTPNEQLKLNLGLDNGWSGIRDTGRRLTIEFGGTYIFNPIFSVMLQGLSGEQRLIARIAKGPTGIRQFVNIIGTCNATPSLSLALSGDYGTQSKGISATGVIGRTIWEGISAYVNYQFNDKWRTTLRGELYDDQDGYTTSIRQNWRELTVTLAYQPIKNAELRAETRHDFSNRNPFMDTSGPGLSNNQQSYGLEAIYRL